MNSILEALYQDIRQAFVNRAQAGALRSTDRYEQSADFSGYNLRSAQFMEVFKTFLPDFKKLTPEERRALAETLLHSGNHELVASAIRLMVLDLNSLLPDSDGFVARMPEYFHGWGSTDDFCVNLLHPLMLRQPGDVLPLLAAWNHSPNRWARRASVVAFTRKVGESGRFTQDCLRLCEGLVWDTEDLVRKGVGWALKDTLRGEREPVLAYIRDLRRRGVPAVITLYAMRDLKDAERQVLLAIHKVVGAP